MKRLWAYLRELREGVRLLPEVARIAWSPDYWAGELQRYAQRCADRRYTDEHFDEWAAEADEARAKARRRVR